MSLVEALIQKFADAGHELPGDPDDYEIKRTRAGRHQRSAGAWSWFLWHPWDSGLAGQASQFGSQWPAGKCAKAKTSIYVHPVHGTIELVVED